MMAIACPYLEALDRHYEQLEFAVDEPPRAPDDTANTLL